MSKVVKISVFSKYSSNTWRTELVYDNGRTSHLKLPANQIDHYISLGAVMDINTADYPNGTEQKKTTLSPAVVTPAQPQKPQPSQPVQPTKADSASSTVNETAAKKPIQIGVTDSVQNKDQ